MGRIIRKIAHLVPNKLRSYLRTRLALLNVKLINSKIISFSQAGEDYNIRNIFREKKNGFYVDIGAFHPMMLSNTFYFYLFENWRGINIDPRPDCMKFFNTLRPRDINLEFAVSSEKKLLTYYIIDELNAMNTFSKEFLEKNHLMSSIEKTVSIQALPLAEILDEYLPTGQIIDFINIDAEGMDIDILKSNNWQKYRPKLLLIESDGDSLEELTKSEVAIYMDSLNYQPKVITYLNNKQKNVIYFDNNILF